MSAPTTLFGAQDHEHMARALRLAARVRNAADPNPRVGCVLVRAGERVGEGWHARAGEGHAEINALNAAGGRAAGATAYVTLEPCSHQGRTPPCVQALIAAGVSRVVAAVEDPNPLVAGSGLAQLNASGIHAVGGCMEAQAVRLNRGFFSRHRRARPFVVAKLAASLDGATAMTDGTSKWITGEAARSDVQRLRSGASAIMTGVGTVLADDPALNVRLDADPAWRQPWRVIVDSTLRTPPSSRMFALPGEVHLFHASDDAGRMSALASAGARLHRVAAAPGGVDVADVLGQLAALEVNEVMLEAGPTLAGELLGGELIDEVVLYLAPHFLGSATRRLFRTDWLEEISQRRLMDITDMRRIGDDLRITLGTLCGQ